MGHPGCPLNRRGTAEKKPRPATAERGWPNFRPGAQRAPDWKLLGGFGGSRNSSGSSVNSSLDSVGCSGSSGRCSVSSDRSGFHSSGSGLLDRSGRSGSRSGCGSRSRLFLLATGGQGGSSDQRSDDEGLVHFRFSLRRVKKKGPLRPASCSPATLRQCALASVACTFSLNSRLYSGFVNSG